MREVIGDLWTYSAPNKIVMITTNGYVKINGEAVMGRGTALQAAQRYPQLPKLLADDLRQTRLRVVFLPVISSSERIWIGVFPVKYKWNQKASLELIVKSAKELAQFAGLSFNETKTFILPRPGCGNGQLHWSEVKPLIENILPHNVWVISR